LNVLKNKFVHLRIHSEYSITCGLGSPDTIINRLKFLNMQSAALTDHVNLFASIKWYRSAINAGIKPILGADIWIKNENKPFLITLLCQNREGYINLISLISQAYIKSEYEYRIPLIQLNWIKKENLQGLIALSGGLHGNIGFYLLKKKEELAKKCLEYWLKIFPDNRFYIEITRTNKKYEDFYIQRVLYFSEKYNIPIVATQNVYFPTKKEFNIHKIRIDICNGKNINDQNKKNFSEEQYICSSEYMENLFSDIPEALSNTVEIAKRCNLIIDLKKNLLPSFSVPNSMDESSYLKYISYKGLEERIKKMKLNFNTRSLYIKRLNAELSIIISMKFSGYFLIVSDFVQWAKKEKIPVGPGRGSGTGSLVAYVLKITDIDPIEYNLIFERFLNLERLSMPDLDIDFCIKGRDRVIEYISKLYGRKSVCHIISFGTMAAKAAIRDVGRVLGYNYQYVDSIAKLIPFTVGITLNKALNQEPILFKRYKEDIEVQKIIDIAMQLEGTIRNISKHPGGIIIAPSDLVNFLPIYCEKNNINFISQYDKDDIESIGLVKFDLLGLRNLTIINNAVYNINFFLKKKISLSDISLDDSLTFSLLQKKETGAIFQLDSPGMKKLIGRLKPNSFEDIVALLALFRPGPLQSGMVDDFINRKKGKSSLIYPHPLTKKILKSTYGIILYQEQIMQIVQKLGNYTLENADLLLRAIGKKKYEIMNKQRKIFIESSVKNNIDRNTAIFIFSLIEKFANYGFNKSHSTAYALIAYRTAWLKTHYFIQYMAAVFSSEMDNFEKISIFYEELNYRKIKLLQPNINKSSYEFTIKNGNILFGLGAIKDVGKLAIQNIIYNRDKYGKYEDLFDFCYRVDLHIVNKRTVESLIDAGAFDIMHNNRRSMLFNLPNILKVVEQKKNSFKIGQQDIFNKSYEIDLINKKAFQELIDIPIERNLKEKRVLGFFLTDHPMKYYLEYFQYFSISPLGKIHEICNNKKIRVSGIISKIYRIKTRNNTFIISLLLDDSISKQEIFVSEKIFYIYENLLKINNIIFAEIQKEKRMMKFFGKEFYYLEKILFQGISKIRFLILKETCNKKLLNNIKEIIFYHKKKLTEEKKCLIEFLYKTKTTLVLLKSNIFYNKYMLQDLYNIFPRNQIQIIYS